MDEFFHADERDGLNFASASDPGCTTYKALLNPVTFPSFEYLTDLNDPSTEYYTGWETGYLHRSREWCFLGEVIEKQHFGRARLLVKTRRTDDEPVFVSFYPESEPVDGFDVMKVKVGHTLALLNAERKQMMDGSEGIRMEEMKTCWAFKANLADLTDEANKLLEVADAKARGETQSACFSCGKPATNMCGKCKSAAFCSKECQLSYWPKHKGLCKDSAKLLSLACLPRHPFDYEGRPWIDWNSIQGHCLRPPPSSP
jgi:hypothetical protein